MAILQTIVSPFHHVIILSPIVLVFVQIVTAEKVNLVPN